MALSSSCPPQPSPALLTLGVMWRAACEALCFSSTRTRWDTGVHLHRMDRYSILISLLLHFQR
jgi:hypothetical protein